MEPKHPYFRVSEFKEYSRGSSEGIYIFDQLNEVYQIVSLVWSPKIRSWSKFLKSAIACLAKIFDVDQDVIYRDFGRLKDLKASKSTSVVRRGKYFNETFSFYSRHDFKDVTPNDEIIVKLYAAAFDSSCTEFDETPSCDSQLRQHDFFSVNLIQEVDRTLKDEFDVVMSLRVRVVNCGPQNCINKFHRAFDHEIFI